MAVAVSDAEACEAREEKKVLQREVQAREHLLSEPRLCRLWVEMAPELSCN